MEWKFGGDEPIVLIDRKNFLISSICDVVDQFSDPLPDSVFNFLYSEMDETHRNLKEALAKDQSYAGAARCLRELIQWRLKK